MDRPNGWQDSSGRSCSDYTSARLCTGTGGYGPGWRNETGFFSDHAKDGRHAAQACCACGGGDSGTWVGVRVSEPRGRGVAVPPAHGGRDTSWEM